ncbi:hypothetical protein [Paraburkholderia sp.]|uniref:hypothetical protein n=1 Tax=Paraburkholderia sp. TaxID=1926495 RepID=UPI0025D061A7|nr:hypothetical protein [Paraburkholderia sp.]
MNFGLLLPHLPQTQQCLCTVFPTDVHGASQCAPASTLSRLSGLAARWRDLPARVFRV